MHIEYNNYTVKCVYIYIYFLYIYQDIFALKLAVVISYPPLPPKKETPSVHSRPPRGNNPLKSLRAAAPLHLRSMFWKGLAQNNTTILTNSFHEV